VQSIDLTEAECLILWLTATRANQAGSSQQDLATEVGVSPAQMSCLVERLRKRGLMEMTRSPIDRRRQVWRLLAQGEELLGKIRASLGSVAEDIDRLIPIEQQQAAQLVLSRLAEPESFSKLVLRTFVPDGTSETPKNIACEVQGGGQ
jgi:DNA-binding MarR family transcriptional regulator